MLGLGFGQLVPLAALLITNTENVMYLLTITEA